MNSRLTALVVLCAAAFMAVVDETIVAVSLPAIQADLGFTQAGLAWVVNSYLIAFAGLLLLSGRLGDLLGRKRVFLAGLAGFTVTSALCGLAWDPSALVVARFLQGVSGAAMTAVVLGMIATLFPEPGERAKAIGAFSFVQASGGTIGMVTGGLVTQAAGWHWIFYLNVPIGLAAFGVARKTLPNEGGTGLGKGADVLGASLVTAALMLAVYTIVRVEEHGWASAHTLVLGVIAVVLLAAFVRRQSVAANPLLPLRLLRSRHVAGGNVVFLLLVASMFGFMFLTVLYLQRVLGYGPREAGLAMVPTAAAIAVISLGASARVNTRFGAHRVLPVGLALIVGGFLLLGRAPAEATYAVDVLPALALLGTGFGFAMPSLMTLGMSEATADDAGLTSGLFNTVQQVGGSLGLAVLAVLATTRTAEATAAGTPEAPALLEGYHLAYHVAAAAVTAAIVLAVLLLRRAGRPRVVSAQTS